MTAYAARMAASSVRSVLCYTWTTKRTLNVSGEVVPARIPLRCCDYDWIYKEKILIKTKAFLSGFKIIPANLSFFLGFSGIIPFSPV